MRRRNPKSASQHVQHTSTSRRLSYESLEERRLLSAAPVVETFQSAPISPITIGDVVTLSATATVADGSKQVGKIEFYADTDADGVADKLLGTDSDSTDGWACSWDTTAHAAGSITLLAIATDTDKLSSDPKALAITLNAPENHKPVVDTFQSVPTSPILVGQMVTLSAIATDPDAGDAVSKVEFYEDTDGDGLGDKLLGTDSDGTDGWSCSWDTTAHSTGSTALFAVATDAEKLASDPKALSVTLAANVNEPPTVDTVGLYQPNTSLFHLKDTFTPGASDHYFKFGPGESAGWIPLAGDWNGDGVVTIGLYQPDISLFHLKDSFTPGASDHYFQFGPGGSAGWIPLVGDWNGDGIDTIGLYQPSISLFHLKDSFAPGTSDHYFQFGPVGNAGWTPLAGDWDGNGTDTVGFYQPNISLFHLKDTFTPGASDHYFQFGPGSSAGWKPLAGDWNGDGVDTIGLYQPNISLFHLKDTFTPGASDHYFQFGPGNSAGWTPLVGDWNGPETPAALHVAGGIASESSDGPTLSAAIPDGLLARALADWMAAGLSTQQRDLLAGVTFVVADLPGSQLGAATPTTVYLDSDAAGHGWFIDATPEGDQEFEGIGTTSRNAIDPQAVDRIDLLSVVEHELGHVMGFDDLDALADSVMSDALGIGIRRTL